MAGTSFFQSVTSRTVFSAETMHKADCFRSERLFVGINAFRRGQTQRVHAHEGADKFYLVVSGKARIVVGNERADLGPGGLAWAPAGVPHGVEEALEDSVVLVAMAPPPK